MSLHSIDECGMMMAVPPFCSSSGMAAHKNSRSCSLAAATALRLIIFVFVRWCSCKQRARIGSCACVCFIIYIASPNLPVRPSRFLLHTHGPGWGSMPSSVRSRIHAQWRGVSLAVCMVSSRARMLLVSVTTLVSSRVVAVADAPAFAAGHRL